MTTDGDAGRPVVFEDVLYVSDGLVPICDFRGKRVGISLTLMGPGTTIRAPGDRGSVVLARHVAEWMGLA